MMFTLLWVDTDLLFSHISLKFLLSKHYENLSEQFDAMTSYIQELTSMLESYHQQAKEAWPPSTDKACHSFVQETGCTIRSVGENMCCPLDRTDLMRHF